MILEIETDDRGLAFDLFETRELSVGKETAPVDGIRIKYNGTLFKAALHFPETINLILDIAKNVGIGLFTAWLYDKLKGKNVKLRIDGEDVNLSPEEIERKIKEKINNEK